MMAIENKWHTIDHPVQTQFWTNGGHWNQSTLGMGKFFAKRSLLLNSLVDGTLLIKVHMRLLLPEKSSPTPFFPENPALRLFSDCS
jgi:hypothetical protein